MRLGKCFERVSVLRKSQTVAFIGLQAWSLLKDSAIFKRDLASWRFIALNVPGRNGRLTGGMEAFLRGIRRLDPTKMAKPRVMADAARNKKR
jgi:hypothetical protein